MYVCTFSCLLPAFCVLLVPPVPHEVLMKLAQSLIDVPKHKNRRSFDMPVFYLQL